MSKWGEGILSFPEAFKLYFLMNAWYGFEHFSSLVFSSDYGSYRTTGIHGEFLRIVFSEQRSIIFQCLSHLIYEVAHSPVSL